MDNCKVIKQPWLVIVLAAVIVYLALSIPNIELPGVYYDELLQVLPAMATAGYPVGDDYLNLPRTVINIGRFRLPLLIMPWRGPTESMIFVPVFLMFEPSVVSIRTTYIVLGLVSIVVTFIWVRQMLGVRMATITTLLMATDASYIFFTRTDMGAVDTMMIIKMCMLICFSYWWKTGKARGFCAGAFLAGLGVYNKADFLWLIIAGVLVIWLFAFRQVWKRIRGKWGMLSLAGLLFTLGAAPFLVYVLLTGGGPFRKVFSSFGSTTAFGINNLDVLGNLTIQIKSFYQIVSGYEALNFYTTSFTGVQVPFQRLSVSFQPWVMVMAIIAPVALQLWRREPVNVRLAISLALAATVMFIIILSIFTPGNLSSYHLLMTYPFPHLLIANSALLMWDTLAPGLQGQSTHLHRIATRSSHLARTAVAIVVALTLMLNTVVAVHNHRVLTRTQGVGMWSAAIYELADYLVLQKKPVVCMDWGFYLNLLMLSKGELEISEEWHQFLYPQSDTSAMEALLKNDALFVFHAPNYAGVLAITERDHPRQAFFEAARKMGLEIELVQTFIQANGAPVYQVYAVRD